MATPDQILDAAAAAPAETATDGTITTSHSLTELMAWADRHAGADALTGKNAQGGQRSGWGVLRMASVKPPGAP